MMQPLILASGSPRRRELLTAMGLPFEVQASTVDESLISADHPRTFAIRAAFAKARDVASRVEHGRWVLGADTVVTRDLVLYGKPRDRQHAHEMLSILAGQSHQVITGIALVQAGGSTAHLNAAQTNVWFKSLTADQIADYVHTGEPMDKAGAYGIQGAGGALVSHIQGDYFNVVGLPCGLLATLLEEAGLEYRTAIPDPPAHVRIVAKGHNHMD